MRKEIDYIIFTLKNTLEGTPWYGRSVHALLEGTDPALVHYKPSGASHSLIGLLYHMWSWAEFTRMQLEGTPGFDPEVFEETRDWPIPDPGPEGWEKGLALLRSAHEQILLLLQEHEDEFLSREALGRSYNFRFLLQGLIQHNIYHAGQIAYLKKLLEDNQDSGR